jgi:acyl carrier protein
MSHVGRDGPSPRCPLPACRAGLRRPAHTLPKEGRRTMPKVTTREAEDWLIEKIAHRLGVATSEVSREVYFDELDLDSTEALILAGELENWLGFELSTTTLWYHPTVKDLAAYLAEESDRRAAAA